MELPEPEAARFRESMVKRLEQLRGCDGVTYGSLAFLSR